MIGWLTTVLPLLLASESAPTCLTDEMIDQAVGAEIRAGAFVIDTRNIPDIPLCSGLTLAQQIQRIRADAFPPEPEGHAVDRFTRLKQEMDDIDPPAPARVAKARPSTSTRAKAAPKKSAASRYYPSCRAARAAGAAPIRRGDAGYSRKLDRDGDGIACE